MVANIKWVPCINLNSRVKKIKFSQPINMNTYLLFLKKESISITIWEGGRGGGQVIEAKFVA